MNGNKYFLDTNIILYILAGNTVLSDYLHRKILYTSFISEIELLAYKSLTIKEENAIRDFLSQFRIINIDEAVKKEAITLRKETRLKLPDCIIAATAISLQLTLITADKQFKQIERLLLELFEI